MSDNNPACGPPCDALNTKQHRYHLLLLMKGHAGGPKTDEDCYMQAGYSSKASRQVIQSNASRLKSSEKLTAALRFHTEKDAREVGRTRQEAIKELWHLIDTPVEQPPTFSEKIRAIERLAKMCGWDAPTQVDLGGESLENLAKALGVDAGALPDPED